jgi:hypothetical protein
MSHDPLPADSDRGRDDSNSSRRQATAHGNRVQRSNIAWRRGAMSGPKKRTVVRRRRSQSTAPASLPWRDCSVASLAMYGSSREVGARPCLACHARASSRSFAHLNSARGVGVHVRLRDAFDLVAAPVGARDPRHAELSSQLTLHRGGRDGLQSTEDPAHAHRVQRAPLPVGESAGDAGDLVVDVVLGSPSRLVPCSQDVTISPAGSNRPGSRPSTRVPWKPRACAPDPHHRPGGSPFWAALM